MLYYALMFLVVGVMAGALNMAGVAAVAKGRRFLSKFSSSIQMTVSSNYGLKILKLIIS